MKATGMVRNLDGLGRIVVPIELRRTLKWNEADRIEIWVEGKHVALKNNADQKELVGSVDRKLDELGRVVIPKEVRKRLGIIEGDAIEIFVDGDMLLLKKYVPMGACAVTGEVLESNQTICGVVLSPLGIEQFRKAFASL